MCYPSIYLISEMAMAMALRRLSSSINKSSRPLFSASSVYYKVSSFFTFHHSSFQYSIKFIRTCARARTHIYIFSLFPLITYLFFKCSHLCLMKLCMIKRIHVFRYVDYFIIYDNISMTTYMFGITVSLTKSR